MTRSYQAHAAITAICDPAGRTRLIRLRSDGPIALRETPDGVYLVGAAAGPLGGDRLRLELEVGPGATLRVRSAATALTLPGRGESVYEIDARVAGHLDFAPEPTVAVRNCRHRAISRIELGPQGTLRWWEELVLGRHREEPGAHVSRIDVTRDGAPLLRHELRLDGAARSRAVLGRARATGSVVLVGPGLTRTPAAAAGYAVLPLAAEGVLVTAVGGNSAELRRRLELGSATATALGVAAVVADPSTP
ncbi:MAG: urease accessory protein UreD [Streptosporangiaceae bacterium]